LEDRVFVCIGKYENSDKLAVWVMTLEDKFEEITMWDCLKHEKYTLKGRI